MSDVGFYLFVSIPFIAGQWSLPALTNTIRSNCSCFNPLHCGAVVASKEKSMETLVILLVSIPFIAGQWSLRDHLCLFRYQYQVSIPFIAGQWSLPLIYRSALMTFSSFNPLHCGAVVASRARAASSAAAFRFQSPSLRGSGRFSSSGSPPPRPAQGFNPLHCGAVVASPWKTKQFSSSGSFNPLHCGAVVASILRAKRGVVPLFVSIPFIAGQWSLLIYAYNNTLGTTGFNPLHCGAVVASPPAMAPTIRGCGVSIPFIAGQWSLLPRTTPSSLFGVLLRKRRLPCDHIICTRLPF